MKVNLTDLTRADDLTLNMNENSPRTSIVSGNYAYFGISQGFEEVHSTNGLHVLQDADDLGHPMCRTHTSPGNVVKVNLADFTRVGNLTFNSDENLIRSVFVSGDYAYFG